ncbi:6613_t:CDS:2, partial [Dentiscutata erythropus]
EESPNPSNTSELTLPNKICDIINDDNWWRQVHKVLAISQLHGILTQNHRIKELNKLKKLYKSTSTTFLLDYSEDISDNMLDDFSTDENSYIEIEDFNEDKDKENIMALWLTSNEADSKNLLDLETANIDELLASQEHP